MQTGVSSRAALDGRGVCAIAARRAARCAPRVVADVARQRRPRAQTRLGAGRGDWPGRVDRRDMVSPHGQHARAAPLPRQGDHRARVARRATAGIGRDGRASGTPGVSRSAVHAPQSGVRARPHVHVAVFDARVDPPAVRDDGAAVVFVSSGLGAPASKVLLVLAAGARLSAYIGATVGEIGFLRGFWMDGSRRLAWLEDYAASVAASGDLPVPAVLRRGIRLDHVSFVYPGTSRVVLDDVSLTLPAGAVVAIVGENGAGKTTLVKLLAKMYEPSSGSILVDDTLLARVPAAEWRTKLAGAFQDFFRFEFQARHTVGLGDVPRLDDDRAVAAAVDRAGAGDV